LLLLEQRFQASSRFYALSLLLLLLFVCVFVSVDFHSGRVSIINNTFAVHGKFSSAKAKQGKIKNFLGV